MEAPRHAPIVPFSYAWRAFWGNAGAASQAPIETRLKLFARCVKSVLNYRWSRWPPAPTSANNLRALQRKMVACIVKSPWVEGDSPESCARRKGRLVTNIISRTGCWVNAWIARWSAWNSHPGRHPEMPASKLLKYRDANWLQKRRSAFVPVNARSWKSWSNFAGRTDTRACSGVVHTRWEAGAVYASGNSVA